MKGDRDRFVCSGFVCSLVCLFSGPGCVVVASLLLGWVVCGGGLSGMAEAALTQGRVGTRDRLFWDTGLVHAIAETVREKTQNKRTRGRAASAAFPALGFCAVPLLLSGTI